MKISVKQLRMEIDKTPVYIFHRKGFVSQILQIRIYTLFGRKKSKSNYGHYNLYDTIASLFANTMSHCKQECQKWFNLNTQIL